MIASEAATFRAAPAEAATPLEEVPEASTERARVPTAAGALPAWVRVVEALVVAAGVAAAGAGNDTDRGEAVTGART